jgi:hypothetical protein
MHANLMVMQEHQMALLRKVYSKPNFNGNPSEWEDFGRKWKIWWPLQGLDAQLEAIVKVSCFPPKDQASYMRQIESGAKCEDILKEMEQRFAVRDQYGKRERWMSIKCHNEGWTEFQRFLADWKAALQDVGNASPEEAKQVLVRAIPKWVLEKLLKAESKRQRPMTLEEVEQFLIQKYWSEHQLASLQQQVSSPEASVTALGTKPEAKQVSQPTAPEPKRGQRQSRSDKRVDKSSQPKRTFSAPPKEESRCYNCEGFGHVAKDCPSQPRSGKKKDQPAQANKGNNSNTRSSSVTHGNKCYNCQKFGHFASNCPKSRASSPTPKTSRT